MFGGSRGLPSTASWEGFHVRPALLATAGLAIAAAGLLAWQASATPAAAAVTRPMAVASTPSSPRPSLDKASPAVAPALVAPLVAVPWLTSGGGGQPTSTPSLLGSLSRWWSGLGASPAPPDLPWVVPAGVSDMQARATIRAHAGLPDLPGTTTIYGPAARVGSTAQAGGEASGSRTMGATGIALLHGAAGAAALTLGGAAGDPGTPPKPPAASGPHVPSQQHFPLHHLAAEEEHPLHSKHAASTAAAVAWFLGGLAASVQDGALPPPHAPTLRLLRLALQLAQEQVGWMHAFMRVAGVRREDLTAAAVQGGGGALASPCPDGDPGQGETPLPAAYTSWERLPSHLARAFPGLEQEAAGAGDSGGSGGGGGLPSCPVCLEGVVGGDVIVTSAEPACRALHWMHITCACSKQGKAFLADHGCPVCRRPVYALVPGVVPTPLVGGGLGHFVLPDPAQSGTWTYCPEAVVADVLPCPRQGKPAVPGGPLAWLHSAAAVAAQAAAQCSYQGGCGAEGRGAPPPTQDAKGSGWGWLAQGAAWLVGQEHGGSEEGGVAPPADPASVLAQQVALARQHTRLDPGPWAHS